MLEHMFGFVRNDHCLLTRLYHFAFPSAVMRVPVALAPSSIWCCHDAGFCHSNMWDGIFLIWVSLMAYDVRHLFIG